MKKLLLEIIQVLAFSTFLGIAVYGALLHWGAEAHDRISVSFSLLLGFGAVLCIVVLVVVGGILDRIALSHESENGLEAKGNE